MAASIVLTGLSADYPNPGVFTEVNYAQGSAAGGTTSYACLILANKLSTGSGTADSVIYGPDTAVPLQREADVIALAGTGSEAHRLFRAFTAVNQKTALYMLFVAESGGTAATKSTTLATTATGNGTLRFYCGGAFTPGEEFVDVPITSGDTADTIKTNAIAKINAMTHWPIVASSGGVGIITTAAKQKGPRGNDIVIQTQITSGIATTVDNSARTVLASGATADSNTTALATLLPLRNWLIVSAANDTTQFLAVGSQLGTQALPLNNIRQHALAGSSGSVSTANTLSTTLNNARCGNVCQELSDYTPAELAAHVAGVLMLEEAGKLPAPRHNFCFFGDTADTQPKWKIRAPRSGNSPTPAEIESMLKNGTSPIVSRQNGSSYLAYMITTRSLNGSTADYRCREWNKATEPDFFADDLAALVSQRYTGKDIGDDPAQGADPPPRNVVTPRMFRETVLEVIDLRNENGNLKNAEATKAATIAQRETSPTTRMSARVPLQPIDIFAQAAIQIDQVA